MGDPCFDENTEGAWIQRIVAQNIQIVPKSVPLIMWERYGIEELKNYTRLVP